MELEKIKVTELSHEQQKNTGGGILLVWVVVGAIFLGGYLFYRSETRDINE